VLETGHVEEHVPAARVEQAGSRAGVGCDEVQAVAQRGDARRDKVDAARAPEELDLAAFQRAHEHGADTGIGHEHAAGAARGDALRVLERPDGVALLAEQQLV
jgi:hypothetical protein